MRMVGYIAALLCIGLIAFDAWAHYHPSAASGYVSAGVLLWLPVVGAGLSAIAGLVGWAESRSRRLRGTKDVC